MNQTICQLYEEYHEELKTMMASYELKSARFDDRNDVSEFILRAEYLKTLVSLYAELVRETER